MPYYRKPEKELDWRPIGMNEKLKTGWKMAPFSILPKNHIVSLKLVNSGIEYCNYEGNWGGIKSWVEERYINQEVNKLWKKQVMGSWEVDKDGMGPGGEK